MHTTRQLLIRLRSARSQFSDAAVSAKLEALNLLDHRPLRRASQIAALHHDALFLLAFPDHDRTLEAARHALANIASRVRRLAAADRANLDDTGIAGTASRHTFEAPIARWLSEHFATDADIDWSGVKNAAGLEFLMALVVMRSEQDGLESSGLSARRWLRHAKGSAAGTDLAWLLRQLLRARSLEPASFALYDHLEIPVIWQLRNGAGASTHNRLPVARVRYRSAFRRVPEDARRLIATPLPRVRRLDEANAASVLNVTRAALTARCREVYALAHANQEEVYLADLGEGVCVAIYGVVPDRRLSLESNYGYLLLSNGVPIGYGGVTPLYRQANTGTNLFDAFRGSEAGYLWAQTLRAFATLFGVNRFVVNPYQFGADNSEAISSGAFWLYYRLGFRPIDPAVAALASREWHRLRARSGRRTPVAMLKELAGTDLELTLRGAKARERFKEAWLGTLALRASEVLSGAGGTDRLADATAVAARVAHVLGARDQRSWPAPEREAFVALAPIVALTDLAALNSRQRARLVEMMRAKGRARELDYVRAATRDRALFPSLMAVARKTALT